MIALGAMPFTLPGFTETGFPVQEKNGLFWVADNVRSAASTAIGPRTSFVSTEGKGVTQFGAAYAGVGPDWIAAAVASGQAVLIKPLSYAPPALGVILTRDPYRIAFNAAKPFQPDYAILAAPSALVSQAEAESRAGYRGNPTDYGDGGEPRLGILASLPSWTVPAGVGVAILLALAALLKPGYRANAKRGGNSPFGFYVRERFDSDEDQEPYYSVCGRSGKAVAHTRSLRIANSLCEEANKYGEILSSPADFE